MPQSGHIDLSKLKGKYHVPDIEFVDKREIDFANEFRLTFEISFGIGLTLLGVTITNFHWALLVTDIIFLGFGFFSFWRYKKKYDDIKNSNSTQQGISDSRAK